MDEEQGQHHGITIPRPTMGQVAARLPACSFSSTRPVSEKTRQATANTSRNQLQARPVLRPLCRSFRYEIQPRSVRSYSMSPLARSIDSQASPPARGSDR